MTATTATKEAASGDFIFSRRELAELLGRDIVPTRLQDTWNALVVLARGESDNPLTGIFETETREAFTAAGRNELMRGDDYRNPARGVIHAGESFFSALSGYSNSFRRRSLTLSLGGAVKREPVSGLAMLSHACAMTAVAAWGGRVPKTYTQPDDGMRPYEVLNMFVDYSHGDSMKIHFNSNGGGLWKNLGLDDPATRDQAKQVIRIIGENMTAIEQGRTVDFPALRQRLIDEAGLATYPQQNKNVWPRKAFPGLEAFMH